MNKLTRSDLWSLEEYSARRPAFRQQVIAHKKDRQLALSDHVRLYFEDRQTIQYQIQEMLRIERIFDAAEIQAVSFPLFFVCQESGFRLPFSAHADS
jgi:hypothetical protein